MALIDNAGADPTRWHLQADPVDFVRQGALVAMALVLMQQPEARVAPFRKQLAKFVADKHEEIMCRCARTLTLATVDIASALHTLVSVGMNPHAGPAFGRALDSLASWRLCAHTGAFASGDVVLVMLPCS